MGADNKRLSSEQTLWLRYGTKSQVIHGAGGIAIAVWMVCRVLLAVTDDPAIGISVLLRTAVVASEITAGVVCVLMFLAWWRYKDPREGADKDASS